MYFHKNIKELADGNQNFRHVLYTSGNGQLVIMSVSVEDEIGEEIHDDSDQVIFISSGKAEAIVNGDSFSMIENDVLYVPAGMKHNLKNIGLEDLKLYTIYCPPHHPEGTVHKGKENLLY